MQLTKSKFLISLILISVLINMTSCTSNKNRSSPTNINAKASLVSAKMSSAYGKVNIFKILKTKSITRKDSKLSTIPTLDFTSFDLNTQINNLINNPGQYNNQDFSNGVVQGIVKRNHIVRNINIFIISERYKSNIIQDIRIGTPFKYIKTILGAPSFSLNNFIVYKTKQYYLGFKGNEKVEQAVVVKKAKSYDPIILKTILTEFNKKDYFDSIYTNSDIKNFIDSTDFSYGGFHFWNSLNGVVVLNSNTNCNITIYNNFEGKLFKYDTYTSEFPIIYKNEDFVVILLSEALDTYLDINKKFDTMGILSPSGKLKFTYSWFRSESYDTNKNYLTIRKLDFSEPDLVDGILAKDAIWLSDDYILYDYDMYGDSPHILKISSYRKFDKDYDVKALNDSDIDVVDKLKINQYPDHQCEIKYVKNNTIFLETLINKKIYKIKYSFDKNGLIQLTI